MNTLPHWTSRVSESAQVRLGFTHWTRVHDIYPLFKQPIPANTDFNESPVEGGIYCAGDNLPYRFQWITCGENIFLTCMVLIYMDGESLPCRFQWIMCKEYMWLLYMVVWITWRENVWIHSTKLHTFLRITCREVSAMQYMYTKLTCMGVSNTQAMVRATWVICHSMYIAIYRILLSKYSSQILN